MKKHVPGCQWAHEEVLVGLRARRTFQPPPTLLADLSAAGVGCMVNLLDEDQARETGADALFVPLGSLAAGSCAPARPKRLNMACVFWPAENTVPTARQMRQTLDEIDEAHAVGLTVFLHGVDVPARAVMAAACWLARHEGGTSTSADPATARLRWLPGGHESTHRAKDHRVGLTDAQRAFVADWPAGRRAEPVLTTTELLDEIEPYPTATAEHWLRTLPTVRVYPEGRRGRAFEVPVVDEKRVRDGTNIDLELDDLHAGTWVGERTLRLLDGMVVVFISPFTRRSG